MSLSPAIVAKQKLASILFIVLFAIQFVIQLLIYTNIYRPDNGWYGFLMGMLAVAGYVVMKLLASNTISDIFSVFMIGEELFFAIGVPFLLALDDFKTQMNAAVLFMCAGFNLISLYLWSLLYQNSKFNNAKKPWIYALSIPYIVNFVIYSGYIEIIANMRSLSTIAITSPYLTLLSMVFALIMPVGYWKLCHSRYFSGKESNVQDSTRLNPLNIYTLIFLAIIVVCLIPF